MIPSQRTGTRGPRSPTLRLRNLTTGDLYTQSRHIHDPFQIELLGDCADVSFRDEDAPAKIEDSDAVKPEGWLDDEEEFVPDPNAEKPEDW